MKTKSKNKFSTAAEFDDFCESNDITDHIKLNTVKVNRPIKRVNVDITLDILDRLDDEAHRLHVPRTALIKVVLGQYLDGLRPASKA